MSQLIVDFIISLDGYASAEGWPGWWGLESPEYLAWLDERPDRNYTLLMGANTYRLMSGFATSPDTPENEAEAMAELTRQQKVVFSSTLEAPLPSTATPRTRAHVLGVRGLQTSGRALSRS